MIKVSSYNSLIGVFCSEIIKDLRSPINIGLLWNDIWTRLSLPKNLMFKVIKIAHNVIIYHNVTAQKQMEYWLWHNFLFCFEQELLIREHLVQGFALKTNAIVMSTLKEATCILLSLYYSHIHLSASTRVSLPPSVDILLLYILCSAVNQEFGECLSNRTQKLGGL